MIKRLSIYIAGILIILSAVCYNGADRLCNVVDREPDTTALNVTEQPHSDDVLQPSHSLHANEVLHVVHSFQFHSLSHVANKSLHHLGRLVLHSHLVNQQYLLGLSHSHFKSASRCFDGYYLYFLRKILL